MCVLERQRATLNDSCVCVLAWCRGLKNVWCWFAVDTVCLSSLSVFPCLCIFSLYLSLCFSLSVHVECLPGSIKGTGRQRSPTSKPSPLAVFSHTIRLHTHSDKHTHAHTQEDRKASQKASLRVRMEFGREKTKAKMDVGMMGWGGMKWVKDEISWRYKSGDGRQI